MLAHEYLEGQSCKKKRALENSKNRQIITNVFYFSFGSCMSYTNQCFLVEVATSTSCSMHTQVENFHIVMEI